MPDTDPENQSRLAEAEAAGPLPSVPASPEPSVPSQNNGVPSDQSSVSTTDTNEEESESDQTLPSQKLIYDIAIKKVDALDRHFDTLNVRAGAILGFAGFILPNALSASKEVGAGYCQISQHKYYWPSNWVSKTIAISEFVIFLIIAWLCYRAYQIESDRVFPSLSTLYRNDVRNPEWKTRELLIGYIDDMCNRKSKIIAQKSNRIQKALFFLVLEIILISAAFCLARLCS